MRYEKLVKDFIERTMDNLAAIDELVKAQGKKPTVFETTQLVNSCLGLIVMPKEKHINDIPNRSIQKLKDEGWPIPQLTNSSEQRHDLNLRQLIEYLRNAIAHFHIEFNHGDDNQINGLKLWNEDEKGARRWESILGVHDLRKLAKKISEEIVPILKD